MGGRARDIILKEVSILDLAIMETASALWKKVVRSKMDISIVLTIAKSLLKLKIVKNMENT